MRVKWFAGLAIAGIGTFLVACGGGGGGSSGASFAPAPVPSTTAAHAPSSAAPVASPVASPTHGATAAPSSTPTATPTHAPSAAPTVAPIASPSPTPSPTPTPNLAILPVTAKPADSVVDMIGVGTHFAYSDTVYKYLTPSNPAPNGDSVLSSLRTLGVRHLRDGDGQMATNPVICGAFASAYAAGTDADIVLLPTDTAAVLPTILSCAGGGLRALEGPNELDLSGDRNYAADDVAFMTGLAAARGSAYPASVLLFAPSMANTCTAYAAEAAVNNDAIAALFDYNNAHIYFSGYAPENTGYGTTTCPAGRFGTEQTDVAEAKIPAPSKPFVVTETGYPDNCCSYNDDGAVSPAVKTKYTLRTLLGHYLSGAKYAYIYELASEKQSFGLTDALLNPKPAYTALENFIRILRDPGGLGAGGALRYSLTGAGPAVGQLLLQKQDGSFWLVLWQASSSWDPLGNVPIAVPPVSGTISFGVQPTALRMYTFDPTGGSATSTALVPAMQLNVTISDTPEILEIGPTGAAPILATPQPPVF